jgi:hypothetical protein
MALPITVAQNQRKIADGQAFAGLHCGSLVSEHDHRIDSSGTPRGQVARSERDKRQQTYNSSHGHWIMRGDAEQHARYKAREPKGGAEANGDTCQCHLRAIPKHHSQDLPSLGPERHTDGDFMRSLTNEMRDYAIDADAGHEQRKGGKRSEHDHREAPSGQPGRNGSSHDLLTVHDEFAVDLLQHAANRRNLRKRSIGGPEHHGNISDGERHETIRDLED